MRCELRKSAYCYRKICARPVGRVYTYHGGLRVVSLQEFQTSGLTDNVVFPTNEEIEKLRPKSKRPLTQYAR